MLVVVIVLFTKGGGYYRGIGLIYPIWKVLEVRIDNRLKVLDDHDCLNGFLAGRCMGTAATEVKLAHHLSYIEQVPLYGVFIDLQKAYDAMDRGRCLEILEAYGVGPKMLKVIRFLGPRCAGMSRRRLLWGAIPGSEGHYVVRPFLTTDLQHYG